MAAAAARGDIINRISFCFLSSLTPPTSVRPPFRPSGCMQSSTKPRMIRIHDDVGRAGRTAMHKNNGREEERVLRRDPIPNILAGPCGTRGGRARLCATIRREKDTICLSSSSSLGRRFRPRSSEERTVHCWTDGVGRTYSCLHSAKNSATEDTD